MKGSPVHTVLLTWSPAGSRRGRTHRRWGPATHWGRTGWFGARCRTIDPTGHSAGLQGSSSCSATKGAAQRSTRVRLIVFNCNNQRGGAKKEEDLDSESPAACTTSLPGAWASAASCSSCPGSLFPSSIWRHVPLLMSHSLTQWHGLLTRGSWTCRKRENKGLPTLCQHLRMCTWRYAGNPTSGPLKGEVIMLILIKIEMYTNISTHLTNE